MCVYVCNQYSYDLINERPQNQFRMGEEEEGDDEVG